MNKLSFNTLNKLGYTGFLLKEAPVKVLQFGEGNFLRAFADCFIDILNEKTDFNGKVVVVQPISSGLTDLINDQEGLFTLFLRGIEKGKAVNERRVISSISHAVNPYADYDAYLKLANNDDLRFIISNTTEAGIVFDETCKLTDTPPKSFPAKLTAFLYERFQLNKKGFIILSCELIEYNGTVLKECVKKYIKLWHLSEDFANWVENENIFCSTLVDRIVTGYPRSEATDICNNLGYIDNLIDTGETFGFWVIEGPKSLENEFPVKKARLPIIITDNHKPYKDRKVRILNGAHTSMVLAAYCMGHDIVRECMMDKDICDFMQKAIFEEIIPTLDLPKSELDDFAAAVFERFQNPHIDHSLLAISLNSTSKWRARVMPSLLEYVNRKSTLPDCLTFSFAAYINFYTQKLTGSPTCLMGKRGKETYEIKDDDFALEFFFNHKDDSVEDLVSAVISNTDMWGDSLLKTEGFGDAVITHLNNIRNLGVRDALKKCLG